MAPLYLGVRFVIAKSFARIHRSNLINSGILPLVFENPNDYEEFSLGDEVELIDIMQALDTGNMTVKNATKGVECTALAEYSDPVHSIRIYNVYGTEVAQATDTDSIDLSHLPAGVYMVRADGKTMRIIKK